MGCGWFCRYKHAAAQPPAEADGSLGLILERPQLSRSAGQKHSKYRLRNNGIVGIL